MTASLYPGAPLPVLSNTHWPCTNLAPTPTWSTTPAAPIWPSLAWMLAHFMPSLVMPGTSRAEREKTVCMSTRQHVRRSSFFLHFNPRLSTFLLNLKMIIQLEVTPCRHQCFHNYQYCGDFMGFLFFLSTIVFMKILFCVSFIFLTPNYQLCFFCFFLNLLIFLNRTFNTNLCQCLHGNEQQCSWALRVLGCSPRGLWIHSVPSD